MMLRVSLNGFHARSDHGNDFVVAVADEIRERGADRPLVVSDEDAHAPFCSKPRALGNVEFRMSIWALTLVRQSGGPMGQVSIARSERYRNSRIRSQLARRQRFPRNLIFGSAHV